MHLKKLSPLWILLLIGVILIRLSILKPEYVEKYYARGIYPFLGIALRFFTGLFPFSVGDILYIIAILLIMREIYIWIRWVSKKNKPNFILLRLSSYVTILLSLYLLFNVFWGLNYNRRSVGYQLELESFQPNDSLLFQLAVQLRDKTNKMRPRSTFSVNYNQMAVRGYNQLSLSYPIPKPVQVLVKGSIFGIVGNYMGYSGYFNPFTGEGQVNSTIPEFMIPFVACHEMAHQLGYAKEHEASFIGHLAAKASGDPFLQYSSYLNMFLSAHGELRSIDSTAAKTIWKGLNSEVMGDIQRYRDYLKKYDTPIGDWVDQFYNQYLKLNEQPSGMRSYNLVTVWLMAWMRKYGDV